MACGKDESALRSVDTLTFDNPTAFVSDLKAHSHGYTAQTLSQYRWQAPGC